MNTVIVTLQGVDALYEVYINILPNPKYDTKEKDGFTHTRSTGYIFYPFAIYGLLRLLVCLWFTSDFTYVYEESLGTITGAEDSKSNEADPVQMAENAVAADPSQSNDPERIERGQKDEAVVVVADDSQKSNGPKHMQRVQECEPRPASQPSEPESVQMA